MQALAGVTDQIREPLLDIQVNVFELDAPLELVAFDLVANLPQPALDIRQVDRADDAALAQHLCVSERAVDVRKCQSAVETD